MLHQEVAGTAVEQQPKQSDKEWTFSRDGFLLKASLRPFTLEVFCGSGRLTKQLRQVGLDSFGVDWRGGRLALETPAVLMLNLTLDSDQRALRQLIAHPFLVYLHLAPPCGTCSRAREIPVKDGWGPPPLRSEQHPFGLPDLAQKFLRELPRVLAANKLYEAAADAVDQCMGRGVLWSVENPRSSLLWAFPRYKALLDNAETAFT